MKLYGSYTSPFVRHIRVVLETNQSEYTFVETDYDQSAQGSPAQKVPYLSAQGTELHDSFSILRYLREQANQPFLADIQDFDTFCLINTALDACINLFLLERDGVTAKQAPYLNRQHNRIDAILTRLDQINWSEKPNLDQDDVVIRLVSFLDWAVFRERLTLTAYPQLDKLLSTALELKAYAVTAPPRD